MRAALVVALAVAVLCGAVAATAPSSSSLPAGTPSDGMFVVTCRHSHTAPDDPIVFPGEPGASHLHEFFGATVTDASTGRRDLRGATTTCDDPADRSSYWTPALLADGERVPPVEVKAYYLAAGRPSGTIASFPSGLEIVAGDASARAPQALVYSEWSCADGTGPRTRPAASPGPCPTDTQLRHTVRFPDCWNGTDREAPDHRSHLAYGAGGACPDSHPVAIPQLVLQFRYPGVDGATFELASGGAYSGHADFFDGWHGASLARRIAACLDGGIVCADGDDAPGDRRPFAGQPGEYVQHNTASPGPAADHGDHPG